MIQPLTHWVLGHRVTPYQTTGDYNLVKGDSPAGAQGPPPHIHQKYEEVFYILHGQMDFVLDGGRRTAKAGEVVNIPSGCLHTFSNTSGDSCIWLNIHSPKGFQSFFDAFGVPDTEANAMAQSLAAERIAEVMDRAKEFDMDIVLPKGAGPS
jgi:mannose-6-phosphate isomerase-like protein (cupin superfamily)